MIYMWLPHDSEYYFMNNTNRGSRKYKLEIVYKLITPSYVDTCTCAHMILNIYHICIKYVQRFKKINVKKTPIFMLLNIINDKVHFICVFLVLNWLFLILLGALLESKTNNNQCNEPLWEVRYHQLYNVSMYLHVSMETNDKIYFPYYCASIRRVDGNIDAT